MLWETGPPGIMTAPDKHESMSLELLLSQLQSAEAPTAVRLEAASQLAEISEPQVVHAFLSILQQESEARLVMHVISLLARKKVYSAVDPLIDVVLCTGKTAIENSHPQFSQSDPGIRIRVAATQALGRMGDERAIVPLMDLLGNQAENYRLRLAAAESLGKLGDTQAVNPLLNIVKDDYESSQYLKESAIKALGMLGDIRALEPLLDMFEQQRGFKNKFNFLKERIVEAIGRLGPHHNRARQALFDALEDEAPSIRLSAVESLAEIGDNTCIPVLKQRLFDPDDDVAFAAIAALYHVGGEAVIREILDHQENLPQFIRQELESYVP